MQTKLQAELQAEKKTESPVTDRVNQRTKEIDLLIEKEMKIIQYSAQTILTAAAAPISFVLIANHHGPFWLAFTCLFGFCFAAFYLQTKRIKLSKQTERKPHRYQIGDTVAWRSKEKKYVITKYGFNHYYLKPIDGDQVHLVNRRQIEL